MCVALDDAFVAHNREGSSDLRAFVAAIRCPSEKVWSVRLLA